ncbi:MAG: hypothetical protein LBM06_01655 [Prevotellaceae bacterium]|jgi:YD repeat-containing protein|nr:hypothetical protein [Prevotellaceae bacterium]
MKQFSYLAGLGLALVLLAACGKDDEENGGGGAFGGYDYKYLVKEVIYEEQSSAGYSNSVTKIEYDDQNRPIRMTGEEGVGIFTYGGNTIIYRTTDSDGDEEYIITLDDQRRVIFMNIGDSKQTYTYDANGYLLSTHFTSSGTGNYSYSYEVENTFTWQDGNLISLVDKS